MRNLFGTGALNIESSNSPVTDPALYWRSACKGGSAQEISDLHGENEALWQIFTNHADEGKEVRYIRSITGCNLRNIMILAGNPHLKMSLLKILTAYPISN